MTQISKHGSRASRRPGAPRAAPAARPPRTPREAARRTGPLDACLRPELFRALADPTRAALLACLAKCARPCSVSEVAACCAVDFSVVSRHLALLAHAGVLEVRKTGRVVHYAVRFRELSGALRALAGALDSCCPSRADGACAAPPGACASTCAAP